MVEEEDYIDDDGAVDDDKRDAYMARQEEEEERKQNLLLTLMRMVKIESLEQKEADALDLRRHRERFLDWRGKRRKFKRQWYCDPVTGTGKMRRVTPKLSGWWLDYIENPEPGCRDLDCHMSHTCRFWSGCLATVVMDCSTDGGQKWI